MSVHVLVINAMGIYSCKLLQLEFGLELSFTVAPQDGPSLKSRMSKSGENR